MKEHIRPYGEHGKAWWKHMSIPNLPNNTYIFLNPEFIIKDNIVSKKPYGKDINFYKWIIDCYKDFIESLNESDWIITADYND